MATPLVESLARFDRALADHRPQVRRREVGEVLSVERGVARVSGLPGVRADEVVRLSGGVQGLVFDLDEHGIGVVLLGSSDAIGAGSSVTRTTRVLDVPVGEGLLGRVVDPNGDPLDDRGPVRWTERRPVERLAPRIADRAPVAVPLQTGLVAVDAMIPIGRGQRELVVGDRQTGKTALAVDTILAQLRSDVVSIYCAIGQRNSAVARVVSTLRERGALPQCVVVVADAESAPGLQFVAPYAATSIAEHLAERGRDVLVIYDDLTRHARAYREISLLLRRPPGREAFPGDIFYVHSRLLERATRLTAERGGGSITALPIVETEAQNVSAYIPTNLISITDGQVVLSPVLFSKGLVPAVDVGRSVSRVGGKAQLPAYRAVAAHLRLAYAQFEELETFSRFGTRLDEETRARLEHGRRVRQVLVQPQYAPIPPAEQVAVLLAVNEGLLDPVPAGQVGAAASAIRVAVREREGAACAALERGAALDDELRAALLASARAALDAMEAAPLATTSPAATVLRDGA